MDCGHPALVSSDETFQIARRRPRHHSPGDADVIQVIDGKAAVMIGSSLAGAIAFWAAIYGWGKWLHRPRPEPRLEPVGQDLRLDRIERALEAIAIEVERLGEGQRYATKLLAERLPSSAPQPPSSPPRVITPH